MIVLISLLYCVHTHTPHTYLEQYREITGREKNKKENRYKGTEINHGMWTLCPLWSSEVLGDYFLTPQVPQGQKFSRCCPFSSLLFLVLFTLGDLSFG